MWRSERMLLYRGARNSLEGAPDACFRQLEAGLRLGRNEGDANSTLSAGPLRDFVWFATDRQSDDAPSSALMHATDAIGLAHIALDDDLEQCLGPYEGITKLYELKEATRLWDMSRHDTLNFLENHLAALEDGPSAVRLLNACFQWNPTVQQVVRNSTLENDVALCKLFVARGVFTAECPGWYHPTLLAFSDDDMHIEKIHRREIVLIDPAARVRFVSRGTSMTSGAAAPKKRPRAPRAESRTAAIRRGNLF